MATIIAIVEESTINPRFERLYFELRDTKFRIADVLLVRVYLHGRPGWWADIANNDSPTSQLRVCYGKGHHSTLRAMCDVLRQQFVDVRFTTTSARYKDRLGAIVELVE